MAKTIATISGVALRPGVSLNRRLYTAPVIAKAVATAQERIREGSKPIAMMSHHQAGDDSRQLVAHLTGVSLGEDGEARYTAAIADTQAGRDIASLIDSSDGSDPHLKGVSIRGFWTGTVRKVKADDGKPAETADGLEWDGLDFTKSPGVHRAEVDTFAWADRSGRSETTERVPIYESVQEARVTTITEEAAPPLAGRQPDPAVAGMAGADFPAPHVLEDGVCVTCPVAEGGNAPGDGSKPYGKVAYADPGYQADKKKRYPVDTKAHARAALAYISKKANAAKYSATQLARVKRHIFAACKKFGIKTSAAPAESAGWVFDDPAWLAEKVAECMIGCDPAESGSYCLTASNGPTNITISDYRLDPAELDPVLRKAVDAACAALAALDPDMDGDIDVPGAPNADTDHDRAGESAGDDPLGEAETDDPAASPAAATTEREDPAMAETTIPAAASAPAVDQKALAEAVTAELERREAERKAGKKAAKKAAREATEAAENAARKAAENAALGQGIPATAGASVSETEDQRRARLAKLVDEQFAAVAAKEGLTTAKTDEQLVAEMLEERMVPLRQARAENGGVQRKGLETLESIADGAPGTQKMLQEASNDDLARLAAAAYPPPVTRR